MNRYFHTLNIPVEPKGVSPFYTSMPVILLSDNYNVTRDDIEQIARLDTIDNERWSQEQAQTIVLGVLLVMIALLMLALTALECYKMNFCGLSSRRESAKVIPTATTTANSSSSSLAVLVEKSRS
ncbi:hypothetical protein KIN20_004517 [Parelaphostrongylus tenuis]|uniref:Uncharacterized protein n=1 Tax=Parelaphostrongylus tenuis TaxID=148309 RepID=A0AAD5M1U6_PARTN|nr:hypothetical protein KIN20_004517 [Parelaphostrongylus tenuis]